MYFYCRNTSGRPKREVILIFTTAESCGATTKRQGVVPRNSPLLSALQSVAPILRYIAICDTCCGLAILVDEQPLGTERLIFGAAADPVKELPRLERRMVGH